jgi:hypothetical protein
MIEYFVSYSWTNRRGDSGFGYIGVLHRGLVRDASDVKEIADCIRKSKKFSAVSVLYWRRFEEPAGLLTAGKEVA